MMMIKIRKTNRKNVKLVLYFKMMKSQFHPLNRSLIKKVKKGFRLKYTIINNIIIKII
jgi:hypothetical protein